VRTQYRRVDERVISPGAMRVAPGRSPLLTVDEAKAYLGLWGDSSQDGLVEALALAAESHVESVSGRPVRQSEVTALYPALGDRLLLRQAPAGGVARVEYTDRHGADQTVTDIVVDDTGGAVGRDYWCADGREGWRGLETPASVCVLSPVPDEDLSRQLTFPVRCRISVDPPPALARVAKVAAQMYVQALYPLGPGAGQSGQSLVDRGATALSTGVQQAIARLLDTGRDQSMPQAPLWH